MKKLFILISVILLLGSVSLFAAGGQDKTDKYPDKDLTLIVPWSAGGGTDTIARALVKNAKMYLGVNINVVNKTGGMGVIGMTAVKTAIPDGYTVGLITFGLSTYKLMGLADLSYRDFTLIELLNQSPGSISVKADSKFKTLKDVVEYAKAHPGELVVGHTGVGAAWHLSVASLATKYGVELNYVPFDGAAPTRSALLGGHVDIAATGIDEVKQLYEAGEVRILGVNAEKRYPLFPDVPTFAEAGYGVDAPIYDWRGVGLPKGVPANRVKILQDAFKKMFDDAEFQKFCADVGLVLVYKDAVGFEKFLASMEEVLKPALKTLGLLK